ncbi:hypothetical protein [Aquabacter cavernae]|uniref:hypothetical protein n=1 Tax=Aquabacter cavernae TaxID=2496029 RepID=UPI000F8C9D61|nr:hypothetical protein [Aquabacter cavernae]
MTSKSHAHPAPSTAPKPPHKGRRADRSTDTGPALPAAGPHAAPHLTDPEKTPGTGSLPDPHRPNAGDSTTG